MVLSTIGPDERASLEHLRPGRVVRDRVSGARAVVVQRDPVCARDGLWYTSRSDRPRRDQPWFHLLFDGSALTGYLAQEDLELEAMPTPVEHPLLNLYFNGFESGSHVRNGRHWGR